MTQPAAGKLSELGMSYDFQERNLYKLNSSTKFIFKGTIYYTWTPRCNEFYNVDIDWILMRQVKKVCLMDAT